MDIEQMLINNGPLGLLLVAVFRWFMRDVRKLHSELVTAIQDNTAAVKGRTDAITGDNPESPILPRALKKAAPVLLALFALTLAGCGSVPAQVHSDMQFAYQAWQEDKRPTVADDRYADMPEAERALRMPAARDKARRAFWTQALKTSAFAAGEAEAPTAPAVMPGPNPGEADHGENEESPGESPGEAESEQDGTPDAQDVAGSDLPGAGASRQGRGGQEQRSETACPGRRERSAGSGAQLRGRPHQQAGHAGHHRELGTSHSQRHSTQRGRSGTEHPCTPEERSRGGTEGHSRPVQPELKWKVEVEARGAVGS